MGCKACKNKKPLNESYEKAKEAARKFGEKCDGSCEAAYIFSLEGKTFDFRFDYAQIPIEVVYLEYVQFSI